VSRGILNCFRRCLSDRSRTILINSRMTSIRQYLSSKHLAQHISSSTCIITAVRYSGFFPFMKSKLNSCHQADSFVLVTFSTNSLSAPNSHYRMCSVYVSQTQCSYPHCRGFQSTNRANPLAQKILASVLQRGLRGDMSAYSGDNCVRCPSLIRIERNVTQGCSSMGPRWHRQLTISTLLLPS
jgi:hypothetical protein